MYDVRCNEESIRKSIVTLRRIESTYRRISVLDLLRTLYSYENT